MPEFLNLDLWYTNPPFYPFWILKPLYGEVEAFRWVCNPNQSPVIWVNFVKKYDELQSGDSRGPFLSLSRRWKSSWMQEVRRRKVSVPWGRILHVWTMVRAYAAPQHSVPMFARHTGPMLSKSQVCFNFGSIDLWQKRRGAVAVTRVQRSIAKTLTDEVPMGPPILNISGRKRGKRRQGSELLW